MLVVVVVVKDAEGMERRTCRVWSCLVVGVVDVVDLAAFRIIWIIILTDSLLFRIFSAAIFSTLPEFLCELPSVLKLY